VAAIATQISGEFHHGLLETELNESLILAALDLTRRWPVRSESENFSYEEYHCVRANELLTSGELDLESESDRRLRTSVQEYQQAIAAFNGGLRIVGRHNPGMFLKMSLIHVRDRKEWPQDVLDALSDSFSRLVRAHRLVRENLPGLEQSGG
jgi:hypothetical protein